MSKKTKFVTPLTPAFWSSVTKESEFKGAGTGKYEITLHFDSANEEHAKFMDFIEAYTQESVDAMLEEMKSDDKRAYAKATKLETVAPFSELMNDEGEMTGVFSAKFKTNIKKGKPVVVDANKNKLDNFEVPNNAQVKVAFGIGKPYSMPTLQRNSVPLYLNAIQVIKLGTSTGGSVDDFEATDGFTMDLDSIPTPPNKVKEALAKAEDGVEAGF